MYIGIDLGGTSCRVAATPSLESLANFSKKECKLTHDFEKDFSTLLRMVKELSQDQVSAIGMGVSGDPNKENPAFIDPPNNPELHGKPIRNLLADHFSCPIFLDNDAVTAALGEALYGENYDKGFAFIIWGTGIGGAIVRLEDGKPISEKLDWHAYFKDWEEHCGGNKIRENYGNDAAHLSEEQWQQIMKDFGYHISSFAEKNNVQTIILGGGIALKQSKRILSFKNTIPSVRIGVSSLGEDCGLFGAFALIRNNLQK